MLLAALLSFTANAQVHDMRWLGGYYPPVVTEEFGGNMTKFFDQEPTLSELEDHGTQLSSTLGVFTDESDSIIVYTNGWTLRNGAHQQLMNGDGLNPSAYFSSDFGFTGVNTHIILPWPSTRDSLVLVHMVADTVDGNGVLHSARLYFSLIDRALNNGSGGVIAKNQILTHEALVTGGLTAVRHANGRDWWVFSHAYGTNQFVSFLFHPNGFEGPYYQSIGPVIIAANPGIQFSMDGGHLAVSTILPGSLDLFSFDRCDGVLTAWRRSELPDQQAFKSVQFSPNGERIYVSSVQWLYQFSLLNEMLIGPDTVGVYDGYFETNPWLRTLFAQTILAPDGKIYITTGNATSFMHVINFPDALGNSCGLEQHSFSRVTRTDNSIPYRPNYLLGPVDGSVCDSLGITVGVGKQDLQASVRAQPNPNNGEFVLRYGGSSESGRLLIHDAVGRLVLNDYLPPWSTMHEVRLLNAVPGIYQCSLRWGELMLTTRIVVGP